MELVCFKDVVSFDFPWQLAEGEFILTHGYPAASVMNNYGEVSPHFANEYIFYEMFIAGLNRVAGWVGLTLFFGLLGLAIYLPTVFALVRAQKHFSLLLFIPLLLSSFLINPRILARPEIIADICYLAAGVMLISLREKRWNGVQMLTLGLIFSIWANVHGSFLIGLIILAIWYAQKLLFEGKAVLLSRDITWIGPGCAAVAGSVLNLSGVARFWQPFQLHSLIWGQGTSFEMWPVTFDAAWPILISTGSALVVLLPCMRKQKAYWMGVVLLMLLYLTFTSNRYGIFLGLTILLIIWNNASASNFNFTRSNPPSTWFILLKLFFCFFLVLGSAFWDVCLVDSQFHYYQDQNDNFYPGTLVSTGTSFSWLRQQSTKKHAVLSTINFGSWSQMPGNKVIYALMDSGTHRYSDRVNQLYYYGLFSTETCKLLLSRLDVDTVVLSNVNIYWAPLLNASPTWRLAHIGIDSQLYFRQSKQAVDYSNEQVLFEQWQKQMKLKFPDEFNLSSKNILRGLKLRPDQDSLHMLLTTSDPAWMFDPQIYYLRDWLQGVPDKMVVDALKILGAKMDNHSAGLRILFLLRLKQNNEAAKLANNWNPSLWSGGYQEMQKLRAEALLSVGNSLTAKLILESLWPQPRYSLRWALLCQEVYADNPVDVPKDAQLLLGPVRKIDWQEALIATLNQNIMQQMTSK